MGITNLEEQFTFYASYHHNGMNKLIHIFCVWPILWSALVLLEYVPYEILPTNFIASVHPLNLAFFAAAFYGAVYILMDQKAGTVAAGLVFLCLLTGRSFFLKSGASYGYPAWQLALFIHVSCWIAQFIGHGVFEGRAPALLDNLMQALVMAPFFVFLEVIFPLGYRKDFQAQMWKNVEKEIAKHKAKSSGKNKK